MAANTVEITFQIDKDSQGRTTLKQIDDQLKGIGSTTQKTGQQIDSSLSFAKAAIVLEFFKQAASAAFAFGKEAVQAFNEVKNAELGLQSVAAFKGISGESATAALQNIQAVKDGLISVADASTALKNLLSRGFSLEQSVTILNRFADAAAFGRQGSLSLGEAVRSASEGVKNLNSVLVDNAGVTKNISVILKERGFQMEDLDDKVKGAAAREALYAGLVAETNAQVGDAAKLTNTFAGEQSKLDAAYQKVLASIGEIIASNPELKAGIEAITASLVEFAKNANDKGSQTHQFLNELISDVGILAKGVSLLVTGFEKFAEVQRIVSLGNPFALALRAVDGLLNALDRLNGQAGAVASKTTGAAPAFNQSFSDIGAKRSKETLDNIKKEAELSAENNKLLDAEIAKEVKLAEEKRKANREANDAISDLRAKLQDNPLLKFFDDATKRQREFFEKFPDATQKMVQDFTRASQQILSLDIFKARFAFGSDVINLQSELAKLKAGLGGSALRDQSAERQADIAKARADEEAARQEIVAKRLDGTLTNQEQDELLAKIRAALSVQILAPQNPLADIEAKARDSQIQLAQDFFNKAKTAQEKQFGLEQILSATADISKLTPQQIDIRAKALEQGILSDQNRLQQAFEKQQALEKNTEALRAVEASLDALAKESVLVKVVSETEDAKVTSLGTLPVVQTRGTNQFSNNF